MEHVSSICQRVKVKVILGTTPFRSPGVLHSVPSFLCSLSGQRWSVSFGSGFGKTGWGSGFGTLDSLYG